MHGMKRGVKSPLSNQVPPSNLGAPSNSGLQCPPFQPLNIIVCRRFEAPPQPSLNNSPPIMAIPPF